MSRPGHWRDFWRVQAIVWPIYGLVHYAATLPGVDPDERWSLAGLKAIRAITGLLVTMPLPWLYRRALSAQWRPWAFGILALIAAYGSSFIWMLLDRLLVTFTIVGAFGPIRINWHEFPRGIDPDYWTVLFAWSVAYAALWYWQDAVRHRQQALEHAVAARDARLKALTFQLSPHFLLNTLTSLRSLITEDQLRAREMVTRLAQFMRYTLTAPDETPFREEVEVARAYLDIERARFEHGLDASIDVAPDTGSCLVPPLLLLPLVENAVKHGVSGPDGVRRVRVSARLDGGHLQIEVANLGSFCPDAGSGSGTGAANTRERLGHVYGARHQIEFRQDREWVRVLIDIAEPRHAD